MKITKFNYPNLKQHYFKVVLDGNVRLSSSDVFATYKSFKKLAESIDFTKNLHDLVHIEVNGDSEVILQAIYAVCL